jgi:acid stress-induced BolA-like protein IbaG/YrbA
MPQLAEQIKTVIETKLKDGYADLETLPNDHVCGHVVSSEFRAKSYEDRRKQIAEVLSQHLDNDQMSYVSTLLAYTPEEWSYATEAEKD